MKKWIKRFLPKDLEPGFGSETRIRINLKAGPDTNQNVSDPPHCLLQCKSNYISVADTDLVGSETFPDPYPDPEIFVSDP